MSAIKRTWSTSFETADEGEGVNESKDFNGFVDDDDDEPSFGRQFLPVARLPDNFDGEPVDGMQYLFMVRRDAKRLPNVTRVELPKHLQQGMSASPTQQGAVSSPGSAMRETSEISSSSISKEKRPAEPEPGLPSEEWRSIFLSRFKNLRKNSHQKTISVELPLASGTQQKRIPDRKLRDSWWLFVAGRPSSEWNPPRSEKARKRAERRANVSGKSTRAIDGIANGSARMGGVRLTNGTNEATDMGSLRPAHFQSAYASDVAAWEVQPSVQQEVLVYDESGEVIHQSTTSGSIQEVEELLNADQEPAAAPRMDSPSAPSDSVPDNPNRLHEGEERPVPPRQPTPNLLKLMDNTYCVHLLKYFTHWINLYVQQHTPPTDSQPFRLPTTMSTYPDPSNPVLTQTHARWIFSLLSRVDEELSADDMSQLRMLARACIGFVKLEREREVTRGANPSSPNGQNQDAGDMSMSDGSVGDGEGVNPRSSEVLGKFELHAPFDERACWIIVTAIADFWAQRDLWMDAKSLLHVT